MANLFNYIKQYGIKSFSEEPFNEVDNLIFSSLPYLNFKNIVKANKEYIKLQEVGRKFFNKYKYDDVIKYGVAQKESFLILKSIYNSKRYRNILVYGYKYVGDKDKQFCAMTFKKKKEFIYISFEGTDHLLSGWKENFEMCYKFPVKSQQYAIDYLNNNINLKDYNIIVGGHSKGGNLALVSSMFCSPLVKFKIKKIYNNDGQGLRDKEYQSKKYKNIEKKLIHIIPNYSLVGLLLKHNDNYKVVKSSRRDLMAHSILTWQVKGNKLVKTELSEISKKMDKSITLWLEKYDEIKRRKMISTIFESLGNSGVHNLYDLKDIKTAMKVIKKLSNIDKETKKLVLDFLEFNLGYILNNYSKRLN